MSFEKPQFTETIETPADRAEKKYQQQLLPIIEILKPDGISFDEYESSVTQNLFDNVKKIQIAQGNLVEDPEKTMDQVKEMLTSQMKSALEDFRNYNKKEKPDIELVKKAKIALLYENDLTDFEKYYSPRSQPNRVDLRALRGYIANRDSRLSESDIEALMKTEYKYGLVESCYSEYFGEWGNLDTIPSSLLIALAESDTDNKYTQIKGALQNAQIGKYDRETFKKMCETKYGRYAVQFIDKFQEFDIDAICNSPQLVGEDIDCVVRYIQESNSLTGEVKNEILKNVFKRYIVRGHFNDFESVSFSMKNVITEEEKTSEEMHNLLAEGLSNPDANIRFVYRLQQAIAYFQFPVEKLQTPEFKKRGIALIKYQLESSGYDIPVARDIDEIQDIFVISDEALQDTIYAAIPNVLEHYNFIAFLHRYNISEDTLKSPELMQKIKDKIYDYADSLAFNKMARIITNFPSIKEAFPDAKTEYDVIFSLLQKKCEESQLVVQKEFIKNIQESYWAKNAKEKIPEVILAVIEKFQSQYGSKGADLVTLAISSYGVENPESFVQKMESIEQILNRYNHDTIPKDAKVSMGIEYEVTKSIADTYNQNSLLGYKKDIELVSSIANIGKGSDAVHEIALKPNYNPYMLMAEMKLLQDGDFLDLNFEKYPQAARGYHLSMVGDSGLHVTENMFFLNNVMTMAQLTGITAGKEIFHTKSIHSKSFDNFSDTKQKGERCEIKGMSTDSIEQFEKAIITSHHAGIAMQLSNIYLGYDTVQIGNIGKDSEEFEKIITEIGLLKESFKTDQERDILYSWMKLKKDVVGAIAQHNSSFVDSEFSGFVLDKDRGYIDTATHIDIARNKKLVDDETLMSPEFKNKTHIKIGDMFETQTRDFVNTLTNIQNIFLKPPQADTNSAVNAKAALDTMKLPEYAGIIDGTAQKSMFDTGELRDGYYYVQGASEEMITHKAQILLNVFNKNMQKLLEKKGITREIVVDNLVGV